MYVPPLSVRVTQNYPMQPPHFRFLTPMFHPNIFADGNICLDILQERWSAIYDISSVLTSIRSLLTDPNPNSPANVEAARIFTTDKQAYEMRVSKCVDATVDE